MKELEHKMDCQPDQIAAYLDNELSGATLQDFEAHLKRCSSCQIELRTQQQLLCTLDAAFKTRFDLPSDFTRIVKARAESDVSGMRQKTERRRALQVTAMLAAASFALLGTAWQGSILKPIQSIARVARSLFDLAWQTIYDAATGMTVILRLLSQAIILNPHRSGLLLLLAFLIAFSLLPLLIAKYHRTETIE